MKKFFLVLVLAVFFFQGCTQKPLPDSETTPISETASVSETNHSSETIPVSETIPITKTTPLNECIDLCKTALNKGTNLINGPCIGNPLSENPDYVCDIAHNPRQEIDNQTENQCSAFREGKAKHFVELDEKCVLIEEY